MTDNTEDNDDFDIYADLDDNIDLNFNESDNCFDNYKNLTETQTNSSNILSKTVETSDENNENFSQTSAQSVDCLEFEAKNFGLDVETEEYIGSVDNSAKTEPSNDLILNELSILEKSLYKTEDNNKSLVKQNQELRQQMKEKDRQLTVLKTNISSLYKTAKAEIERKKQEIHGLREELDTIIFRRLPRNGIKVDNSDKSGDQQNKSQTEEQKSVSNKSSQTSDRDFRHNLNIKKSPDSSVRSPKERPTISRRSRRSRSMSTKRTRINSPKPKTPQKTRRSRSKTPQKTRRTRSRSSQRNRRERHRTPERSRHRTNSEKVSKISPKRRDEPKKQKCDKSDAKTITDSKKDLK